MPDVDPLKKWRKERPVYTGLLTYFPDAQLEKAYASFLGNKQHLDGTPLHWDPTVSADHLDAALRHIMDHGRGEIFDDDGALHLGKGAWRLDAALQTLINELKKQGQWPVLK